MTLSPLTRRRFSNFRANRPNAEVVSVGIDHYVSILTDPDVTDREPLKGLRDGEHVLAR